jgi:broad specificity phosphatase PhoE
MKNEDISLDFIDDLIAEEQGHNELMELAKSLKAEGEVAIRLSAEQKLFDDDITEGTLSSLRRAQARAEALIERLVRFGTKIN